MSVRLRLVLPEGAEVMLIEDVSTHEKKWRVTFPLPNGDRYGCLLPYGCVSVEEAE